MSNRRNRKPFASEVWNKTVAGTDPALKRKTEKSFDLVDQVHLILHQKEWKQTDLAQALGKHTSEISKWLSPGHNFTLQTIAKLEVALDVILIDTPIRAEARRQAAAFGHTATEADHYKALLNKETLRYGNLPSSTISLKVVQNSGDRASLLDDRTNNVVEGHSYASETISQPSGHYSIYSAA